MKSISLYEFGGSEHVVRKFHKRLVRFFQNSGPVLDIGCGRGIFLGLLAEAGIQGVGVDHSPESLEYCRTKGFDVLQEDARSFLCRHKRKFGGIFCSHVIEHMGYEDAMTFLRLCFNALLPGGSLVMLTPNPEDLSIMGDIFWLDPTHVRPYPRLLLASMLQTTGFQVTVARPMLGHWRMIGPQNMFSYFFKRLVLGRFYGKPNLLMVAKAPADSAPQAAGRQP
jgi:2-polyprenyl-3-methyl-5-hydroxy-6-metoxy-1,4-benzoquinol methylase